MHCDHTGQWSHTTTYSGPGGSNYLHRTKYIYNVQSTLTTYKPDMRTLFIVDSTLFIVDSTLFIVDSRLTFVLCTLSIPLQGSQGLAIVYIQAMTPAQESWKQLTTHSFVCLLAS